MQRTFREWNWSVRSVFCAAAFLSLAPSSASATQVTLAWDPSTSPVSSYVLAYGRTPGVYTTQVDVGLTTTTVIDLVPDGAPYYVVVCAKSSGIVSAPSNEVQVVLPVVGSSPRLVSNLWKADFAGTDNGSFGVWDPTTGMWRLLNRSPVTGSTTSQSFQWGAGYLGDVPVPGDYDADGRTDIAVWRPQNGYWFIRRSSLNYSTDYSVQWGSGAQGDVPVPGDYDGDGRTDIAVWRPGNGAWFVKTSSSNYASALYWVWGAGAAGDVPVPADYDGDAQTDLAVWRPGSGTWLIRRSSTQYTTSMEVQWGASQYGDVPLTGDFDGDGRSDLTVWRTANGVWFVLTSSSGFKQHFWQQWGAAQFGDVPVPNDYDGDGRTDIAVWRRDNGAWFVSTSGSSFSQSFYVTWGTRSDVPIR